MTIYRPAAIHACHGQCMKIRRPADLPEYSEPMLKRFLFCFTFSKVRHSDLNR
jgi:hypothetical protein